MSEGRRPSSYTVKDTAAIRLNEDKSSSARIIQGSGFSWSNWNFIALIAPVTIIDPQGETHEVQANSQGWVLVPYNDLVDPPSPWPPGAGR
jgi:hypothetical protein